jgi:EAL domain-containing protein (putative c-di-GMP-specific phosphodiesterase class I)
LFTAVAEHTAMNTTLGQTVLDAALAAFVTWRAAHATEAPVRIGVQLNARNAQQADLPGWIRTALDRHGLQPSELALDLSESALIEAGSSTLRQLNELRESGVGIGINDFGSGYASLRQLAILPVDAVRVDPSFTAGLPNDATSAKIVHAVAGLAADMGLACFFAGIDTEDQLAALPSGVIAMGAQLGPATTTPTFPGPASEG